MDKFLIAPTLKGKITNCKGYNKDKIYQMLRDADFKVENDFISLFQSYDNSLHWNKFYKIVADCEASNLSLDVEYVEFNIINNTLTNKSYYSLNKSNNITKRKIKKGIRISNPNKECFLSLGFTEIDIHKIIEFKQQYIKACQNTLYRRSGDLNLNNLKECNFFNSFFDLKKELNFLKQLI